MNTYEKASLYVDIYENHLSDLFKPTGVEDIDLLRQYLIRDIRLVNAISSSYAQVENADSVVNSPIPELLELHKSEREFFDKSVISEVAFLSDQYAKNKSVFLKAANFYLKEAYVKYGMSEDAVLDIISKITGLPKERLKEAKDNKMDPTEIEKYLESENNNERKGFNFKTDTIFIRTSKL